MNLFSELIQDRQKRWWVQGEPNQQKNLSEKMAGRAFVEQLGVKVPDLYHVSDTVEEIPMFSQLPDRFVLKPSRGWSANNVFVMVNGKNQLDDKMWTRDSIIESIASQPSVNDHKRTKIMIEEYLEDWNSPDSIPFDYKFHMFGEKCAHITIIERLSNNNSKENKFWNVTEDWEALPIQFVRTQIPQETLPPKPDCWDELCESAKKLGSELGIFMRIDFFATTRGAVFGEFTPQPHGGKGFTIEADKWLGSIWKGKEGAGD